MPRLRFFLYYNDKSIPLGMLLLYIDTQSRHLTAYNALFLRLAYIVRLHSKKRRSKHVPRTFYFLQHMSVLILLRFFYIIMIRAFLWECSFCIYRMNSLAQWCSFDVLLHTLQAHFFKMCLNALRLFSALATLGSLLRKASPKSFYIVKLL